MSQVGYRRWALYLLDLLDDLHVRLLELSDIHHELLHFLEEEDHLVLT